MSNTNEQDSELIADFTDELQQIAAAVEEEIEIAESASYFVDVRELLKKCLDQLEHEISSCLYGARQVVGGEITDPISPG